REFVRVLSSDFFEKIHRSYIINLSYLKTYSRLQGGSVTMENGAELLISRRRLAPFLEKMSRMTLSF
ncbi:MAG: LytTR family transcriptional regulator DNA-binding domain-containing protein, partial [Bacteroidetes bacterium]|nr:LytTR family transcriptional regulator DNA-binding domain-containing protein [Bacteroidota bacterium]